MQGRISAREVAEEIYEKLHKFPDGRINFHGEEFSIRDDESRMEWIIAPVYVSLKGSFEIKLNFENTEYRWVDPAAISNYKTVPGLKIGLRNVMQA